MKLKRMFRKAAAMLLAIVTAFSVIPIQNVFAATGDAAVITFSYTYDSNGNAMHYNSSAVINGYTAGGQGKYKYRMFVDGDTGFCIQPGVPLHTGDNLKEASSKTWDALSNAQQKQSEWRSCMGTRETGAIFPVVMMRNGLLHRRWYGSSLRDAVKPQVHTNRPAPRCTTSISAPIIPIVVQGQLMIRLYPC